MARRFLPGLMVVLLSGCSSVSYYGQLASGQWQLLRAREPVAQVIADPTRPALLREHLVGMDLSWPEATFDVAAETARVARS